LRKENLEKIVLFYNVLGVPAFISDNFPSLEKKKFSKAGNFVFHKDFQDVLKRVENIDKVLNKKIAIVKKYLPILRIIPFVKGFFLSGSFTLSFPKKESDIDIFTVSKTGKIWSARFFSHLFLRFFGISRLNSSKTFENKFCLNHFVTEKSLKCTVENEYQAILQSHFVQISGEKELKEMILKENKDWIEKFFPEIFEYIEKNERFQNLEKMFSRNLDSFTKKKISLEKELKNFFETLFFWAEPILKFFQVIKIKKNKNFDKRFIKISDKELKFHPGSKEKFYLEKYNKAVKL